MTSSCSKAELLSAGPIGRLATTPWTSGVGPGRRRDPPSPPRLHSHRPRRGVYITLLVLLQVSFTHKELSRANISRNRPKWRADCASMSIH